MPKRIEGTPTPESLNSNRLVIDPSEEPRLLEQAAAHGIASNDIGAFYVVIASELPANVDESGYDEFSEAELKEESGKHSAWFYDEDKQRLIGTIPSGKDIVNRMRG